MSRRLEIGALLALCFFLPLFEAPKSIFCVLYIAIWIVNRARARDFGGRWDTWDSLIAAWIASGFVVAPFAGLPGGDEWRGALDVLRYGSVLWLTKRSRYDEREIRAILGALVVSTVIGLMMAIHAYMTFGESLQLNSVGHVNHTAIYLAIMLGVCAAWAFVGRSPVPAIGLTVFMLVALLLTASRAAILVAFAMLIVLAAAHWRRSRAPLAITISLIAFTSALAWLIGAEAIYKNEQFLERKDVLAQRSQVWNMGFEAWRRYPVAGVGMDNYHRITYEQVKAWRAERGLDFDPARYARFGHGHSLYMNTLAERGLIGLIPLVALLLAWLLALWRRRPQPQSGPQEWLLWGAAAGALMITAGVGLVNTSLHHEHGILASLLLGLWLSKRPRR